MASASMITSPCVSVRPLRAAPARRLVAVRAERKDALQSGASDSTKKMTKESTEKGPLGSQQPERWTDADKGTADPGANLAEQFKEAMDEATQGVSEVVDKATHKNTSDDRKY